MTFIGVESPHEPGFSLAAEYEGMTYFHVTEYQSWVVANGEWVRDTADVMLKQLRRASMHEGTERE